MIPILFYKFSLKHIFLLLLGRCANAEFCDKFMFHLWENCQTVFQGNFTFLPQCLMVLFSCTRHFCFHSNYSPVCMRWADVCAPSPLHFSPKHTFLPKDLLFSGDMLSLGFIHTWAQSLGPLSSVEHFWMLFPSAVSCVQFSFVCTCSGFFFSWSSSLLPLDILRAHLTMNATPNLRVCFPGSYSSRM